MAGTGYQSSDLLAAFSVASGIPSASTTVTDATKYGYLAQAQDQIILEIANTVGNVLWGNPTLMTSADGGYTYTFGTDGNGYSLFLLDGHIYPDLNAIPSTPWVPGQDYIDEGITIRSLNNVPFSVAPYFQGITTPAAMSASVQPVLYPPYARILIPIRAVQNFAEYGKRDFDLATRMQARWDREWGQIVTQMRKHLRGMRLLRPLTSGGPSNGGYIGSHVW
jgi:hypothetical protein